MRDRLRACVEQAAEWCRLHEATLVSIRSPAENDLLVQMVMKRDPGYRAFGTGGADGRREGEWLWADGTRVDFQNWNQGEPNDARGGEDWLEVQRDGKWNDVTDDTGIGFVAQWVFDEEH